MVEQVQDIIGPALKPDAFEVRESAAKRALAEAAARRAQHAGPLLAPELGGRGGLEPVRFGDWEVNGLASDF